MDKVISEYMAELGRRGGQAKLKKYGREYFSKIGKKGMASRWAKHRKALSKTKRRRKGSK